MDIQASYIISYKGKNSKTALLANPGGQGLSQDLETGCLKLANVYEEFPLLNFGG